jgi:hypothetical protein
MASQANMRTRVEKAQAAVVTVDATRKDEAYNVTGTKETYTVTVVRTSGVLTFHCRNRFGRCKGNMRKDVLCYHSMAVALHLAYLKNRQVSWTADAPNARRLARIGGRVTRLESDNGSQWIVVRGEKEQAIAEVWRREKEVMQAYTNTMPLDWPMWRREKAVRAALALGCIVIQTRMTNKVVAVGRGKNNVR